jgi:hypothetical protein
LEQFTPTPAAVAGAVPPASTAVASGFNAATHADRWARGLREIGVAPADFDSFAINALRDAYIATNPRPVSQEDVHNICVAAY